MEVGLSGSVCGDLHSDNAVKISLVVPTRNEEATVAPVIESIKQYGDELLVVDGHSTDRTVKIVESLGARVIFDRKKGKGDAIRCAAEAVTGDVVVFIDADGSHDPADIPKLVEPIAQDKADLVIGSRMRGGSDELHSSVAEAVRLIGSTVITQSINLRFGVRLTDYQNGFRAIRTRVLRDLRLCEDITTIEQEMAIKALGKGYRVMEIAAHEYVRQGGESKINVLKVSHRYIYQLVRDLAKPWKR